MAKQGKGETAGLEEVAAGASGRAPTSAIIAARGVKTGEDFAGLMSALMSDVIEGRLTPNVTNAAVNAGGKLLKVVEMQYKYGGTSEQATGNPPLRLAP